MVAPADAGVVATRRTINGFSQNQKKTHANKIVAGTIAMNTLTTCKYAELLQRHDCMIVSSCVRYIEYEKSPSVANIEISDGSLNSRIQPRSAMTSRFTTMKKPRAHSG